MSSEPVFREVVDRCDELLRPFLEKPLRSVLYPAPGETTPLDETQYTHVAMFAVQYGLAQLWRSWGVEPAAVMGHSVGEIVASTVAGMMSLEDGLMLMRERGRLMQSLPRTGLMASLLAEGGASVGRAGALPGPGGDCGDQRAGEHGDLRRAQGGARRFCGNLEAQGVKTKLAEGIQLVPLSAGGAGAGGIRTVRRRGRAIALRSWRSFPACGWSG